MPVHKSAWFSGISFESNKIFSKCKLQNLLSSKHSNYRNRKWN